MIPTEKDVVTLIVNAQNANIKITGMEFRAGVNVMGDVLRPKIRPFNFSLWGVPCTIPARDRTGEFIRL